MSEVNPDEVGAIKKAIRDFVEGRAEEKYEPVTKTIAKLEEKLADPAVLSGEREEIEGKIEKEEAKLTGLRDKYEIENWLLDAAKRAQHIQRVTHTPKHMNSKAKGATGFFCNLEEKSIPSTLVSSFSLGSKNTLTDVIGNAAVLDVNKLLQIECNGRTLLSRLIDGDEDFKKALSSTPALASQIYEGLKVFISNRDPVAHSLTKQIYFPVKGNYHLILPLYPSVLVSRVHSQIRSDFFSDEVKEAKEARKKNGYHDCAIHSYPNLVVQSFGGSKPQNISQLNSERGGKSYLLPSLPPSWQSPEIKAPRKSIFTSELYYRKNVKYWVNALGCYLKKTTIDNMNTKYGRDKILAAIVDDILTYAMELRSLPSGWSDSAECQLPDNEKKWLDPFSEKAKSIQDDQWLDRICHNFASTLNNRLKKYHKVEVDGISHAVWKKGLKEEMKMFRWELCDES
ncbi:type I-F CRISPR-associated protein Csy1 [Maridesulfovibrio hydrothermalis]|nr:type I-F CRISPR-associated protein Csy1 [Maridesulfovibrio hydrothermalis]